MFINFINSTFMQIITTKIRFHPNKSKQKTHHKKKIKFQMEVKNSSLTLDYVTLNFFICMATDYCLKHNNRNNSNSHGSHVPRAYLTYCLRHCEQCFTFKSNSVFMITQQKGYK